MSWRTSILALILATSTACNSLSSHNNQVETQEQKPEVAGVPAFLLDSSKYDSIEYAEDDRYSGVGALYSGDGKFVGSAVLIHPKAILTAQHCFSMAENPPKYFITHNGQLLEIQTVYLKDGYNDCDFKDDLALCLLKEECFEPPFEIMQNFYELTPGENLITVGWSLGYKKVSEPGVMKYYGSLLEDYGKVMRMLARHGSVYFGDSGGAVFEDGGKLVGIIGFFNMDPQTGQIVDNGAARLDFHYKWIDIIMRGHFTDWPWYE
jgi:hypothetical protein